MNLYKLSKAIICALAVNFMFTAQPSFAALTCPTIDLRNATVFNHVRNQNSLGWCYAYSLADLIGYRLEEKVSPFDLAMGLYRTNEEYGLQKTDSVTKLSGGLFRHTFNAARSRGICWERKVSASGDLSAQMLLRVENVANEAKKIDVSLVDYSMRVQRLIYKNSWVLHSVFPTSTMAELVSAFLNLKPAQKPLISVVDNICGVRTPLNGLRLRGGVTRDGEQLVNFLKWKLSDHIPLTIGYSGATLRNVKFSGPVTHASTVVAMKQNRQGECEFLVRNSWGGVIVAPYDRSLRPKVVQGNIWITETLMKQMAKEVYFVDGE